MNKTYNTSKWGEVSEDFLIKKKKKASTCGVFLKFALLFLFLSGVCCAVTVLTIQDIITLDLDTRLLLMVFLGLAAAALLFFVIWTIMFFSFDIMGIKKALNEAREQEIDRLQKEQQAGEDETEIQSSEEDAGVYDDLPVITEPVEEFPVSLDAEEDDPLPEDEGYDEELTLEDEEDFSDGFEEAADDEINEDSVMDDESSEFEEPDEFISGDTSESENQEIEIATEEADSTSSIKEETQLDTDSDDEEPKAVDRTEDKKESVQAVDTFAVNSYDRDNEGTFQAVFDEMRGVFFDHLRNKDNEILALKAQLSELKTEKELLSAHNEEVKKLLADESAKCRELEENLSEALKRIESMEYVRKDSEKISIEMLPQAEIVPLNMEIRIPSIKEVFPEESVKETGFARDMREVEEALAVEE